MSAVLKEPEEGVLRPLTFIDGCNTAPDVIRSQLKFNVQRNLPWLKLQPLKERPLAIVAGGPSLKERYKDIKFQYDILSLNNTYGFLKDRGIRPEYWMLLDARKENLDFVRNVANPNTMHFLAAQCHPSVYDYLEGFKTTLYLTTLPDTLELVKDFNCEKVQLAGTVGTVGVKAIALGFALGYREFHLYGYDSSYQDGEHHAYSQPLNDSNSKIDVYLAGKEYITSPAYAHQAVEFCEFARSLVQQHGCTIELHCSGLLPDLVAVSNALGEIPLEIREREKYEEIWKQKSYRNTAPGEDFVEDAIASLGATPGDSVIDFGCGTGRGAAKFQSLGFRISAVDFAANCLDPGVKVPFTQACLWELPSMEAEYGYCTDVMEHIPSEKVHAVLAAIRDRTRKGVYFNIATRHDDLGGLIGRKLHLTVMPAVEWMKVLKEFWKKVECRDKGFEAIFICSNN